jgi:gas vesicle protein
MKNINREQDFGHRSGGNAASSALAGLVIGGLAGAGAALLLAPQSGKETRAQIQHKTLEIRDKTAETVTGVVTQVKTKTHELTDGVREKAGEIQHKVMGKAEEIQHKVVGKAEEIQHQGQELLVEQLDRVAAAAEAGKEAIQRSEAEKPSAKRY